MPTYAGGCGDTVGSDVPVIRTCATQNVRTATMGEQAKAVFAQKISYMLVYLLLLLHCFRYCLCADHSPPVVSKTLDTVGYIELLNSFSDDIVKDKLSHHTRDLYRRNPVRVDDKLNDRIFNENQNRSREANLKMLLENLTELQKFDNIESEDTVNNEENHNTKYYEGDSPAHPTSSFARFKSISELFQGRDSGAQIVEEAPEVVAQVELILPPSLESHAKAVSSTKTRDAREYLNNNMQAFIAESSIADSAVGTETSLDTSVSKLDKIAEEKSAQNYIDKSTSDNLPVQSNQFKPITYLIAPSNHLRTDSPSNSDDRAHNTVHDISPFGTFDSSGTADNIKQFSEHVNGRKPSSTDSVGSLILKAVKKMENLMNKRMYQYGTVSTTLEQSQESVPPTDGDENAEFFGSDDGTVESEVDTLSEEKGAKDIDENYSDNFLSQKNEKPHDEVTDEVIKAVKSRKVPIDPRFWQKVSDYLDSNDYLSRTRRSADRNRKHKGGRRYVHVSITYGHVMPCEYKDRFYCMNGGTCVFVGALDIRTCRCPIGYTGVRCELIDQEYILSLLTNTLIFR